ncbi:BC_2427 family protein [Bacillus paramobilis]|uniref:BC_2427 family protein n=1 Tax=Bacillus paramobilis TaxID=2817477 RepID=A0ABZ2VVG9_9BACI
MKNPWGGKKIWNKVYKGEILIDQEQSHEIRENKKSKQTDSEKKEKAIQVEKEGKGPERKVKAIQAEKENKETKSKKEEKAIQAEKESKETKSKKEEKAIQAEKENKETDPKKEEKAIQAEKENKEPEPQKEEKENESEKKIEKIVLGKEHKTSGLEGKSIDTESKIANSERSIEVKTPFSIISDVTSFKKFPNMNVKNQEVYVFRNEEDARGRELDSTLLTTMEYYHGEIDCNLVSSNLHEKRVLLELSNQKEKGNIEESWVGSSSWIPIHGIILEKEVEADVNNYITAKLPIEIGRYKGEISLIEKIVFKETVIEIKEVSQEIIVTNKEFLLPKIIKKGKNPSIIEKGSLRVEGYIFQCIEFTSEQSENHDKIYQLMQNIILELNIQLLQEQEVRVRIT